MYCGVPMGPTPRNKDCKHSQFKLKGWGMPKYKDATEMETRWFGFGLEGFGRATRTTSDTWWKLALLAQQLSNFTLCEWFSHLWAKVHAQD